VHRPLANLQGTGTAQLSGDADARSIWLLRRLVLAEMAIALLVVASIALLGITTHRRASQVVHPSLTSAEERKHKTTTLTVARPSPRPRRTAR
jgi:hypothetical protein